jgi:hypothetical protein
VDLAIRASTTLLRPGHTVPDYEYDRFIREKVLVIPGVRGVNAQVKEQLEREYPTTEVHQSKRIDEWIHRLWKKWVQLRLKAHRRLRPTKAITPNTTSTNTASTSADSMSFRQSTPSRMPIRFDHSSPFSVNIAIQSTPWRPASEFQATPHPSVNTLCWTTLRSWFETGIVTPSEIRNYVDEYERQQIANAEPEQCLDRRS